MAATKHFTTLIALILVSLLLFSCSKKLSRSEAEKQIKQNMQLPHDEFRDFNLKEKKAYVQWMEYDLNYNLGPSPVKGGSHYKQAKEIMKNQEYPKSQLFSILENENFITISIVREDNPPNSNWGYGRIEHSYNEFYIASYTDKAKPLINGNSVKVATIEFGEITGIVERNELNVAEVNYTTKRTNITPFGKANNIVEETVNHSATFTKYDDGWRIN